MDRRKRVHQMTSSDREEIDKICKERGIKLLSQEEAIKRYGKSFAVFVKSRPSNTPKRDTK